MLNALLLLNSVQYAQEDSLSTKIYVFQLPILVVEVDSVKEDNADLAQPNVKIVFQTVYVQYAPVATTSTEMTVLRHWLNFSN